MPEPLALLGVQVAVTRGRRLFTKQREPCWLMVGSTVRTSHSSGKQQKRIDPYLIGMLYGDGTSYASKRGAYSVSVDQVRGQLLSSEVVPRLRKMNFNVHFYDYMSKTDGSHKWRALVFSKDLFLWFGEMRRNIVDVVDGLTNNDFKKFLQDSSMQKARIQIDL